MTTLIISLTLFIAIANCFLANYIFYENRASPLFRLIAILCLDLAVFSFSSFMFYTMPTESTARVWEHVRIFSYLLLFPLSFQFTWMWTGRKSWRFTPQLLWVVYTITGALILAGWMDFLTSEPLMSPLGIWITNSAISSPWQWIALAWSFLVDLAILILAGLFILSLKRKNEPNSRLLIFCGLIFPATIGFILSVLQKVDYPDLPSLIPVYILVGNILIVLGILRGRRYLLTPQFAWREIIQSISDAILVVDPQGEIMASNPALLELTGYQQTELERKHLSFIFPEAFSDIAKSFSALISHPGQKNVETTLQTKAGRLVNVLLSYSLIKNPQQKAFGIAFILTDITRLLQTENQLQQTLSLLNATLESIPDAIVVVDRQQNVVAYNRKFIKLWQLPEAWPLLPNIMERSVIMASRCRDPQVYFDRIEQLFNNLEMTAVDLIETKDGRFIERTSQPYRVNNEIMGKVFTYLDITERRRTEDEERAAHAITEVLSSTGTAMSSSLDIDQVLDAMLVQLGRVVPYDTITILNIENGVAVPLRAMGYERFGSEAVEYIKDVTFKIDNTPNLKWMLETRQPLIIPEIQSYPGWKITPTSPYVHSWAGAPMLAHGQAIAFLFLTKVEPDFYTSDHARYLDIFASQAGLAMENARLFAEVKLLAVTDPLTGLSNRRSFHELAESAFAHARRYERPLSVIMVDIDHFKQVNDRHGHFVGDYFLKNLGTIFLSRLRDADIKGRYGGEEFLFLLPETRLSNALRMADRLRSQVAKMQLKVENGTISITVSIGVSTLPVNEDITLESLLIRADEAMYVAKEAGGNRVHVWEPAQK